MSPMMLAILGGCALVGFVLVLLGWRGRRVNDHPICKGCGFDLLGVLPEGITCPECGAGLKREKAIRNGLRRKRWIVVSVGAVMVALPMLSAGVAGYAAITGTDLNRFKPIGLLRWEVQTAGGEAADAAAAELERRYSAGELGEDAKASLVEFVLMLHRDHRGPWNETLGKVIDAARISGDVSEETYQRFIEDAAVLEYHCRETVLVGEVIPVVADLVESRLGSGGMTIGHYWIRKATIGGEPAKIQSGFAFGPSGLSPQVFERDAQVGWVYLYGPGRGWGAQGDGTCNIGFTLEPPEGLGAGLHAIELELLAKTVEQTGAMSVSWNTPPRAEDPKGYRKSTVTLNVRLAEDDPIERIAAAQETDQQLVTSILVSQASASRSMLTTHAWVQLTFTNAPVDFAYEVKLRQGEREWDFGELTTGRLASQTNNWGQTDSAFLQGETKGLVTGAAELVLTPSETVARRTIDLSRIYDGQIVIEDVQIQAQRTGFGSLLQGLFGR